MSSLGVATSGTPSRRTTLRRAALATAVAGALSMSVAIISQAHAHTSHPVAMPVASQINASSKAVSAIARADEPCGYYTVHRNWVPDDAYYRHCGDVRICVKVARRFWPDYVMEASPGNHYLGRTSEVHWAEYVGLPPCW